MPVRPGHSCRHQGCTAIVSAGQGAYCPGHTSPGERARPSASKRGYGRTWGRIRARVLAEQPICPDPYARHAGVIIPAAHVDHIIPKNQGGTDARDNLQGLCASCHSYKTRMFDMDRLPQG